MHNKISLAIAKKFGIEDIDFDHINTIDVLEKLRGEYIDTDPTYATMVDNMDLLHKEGKRFTSEYLNIIEYLYTSDKISEQDKSVFLSYSHHNIFALYIYIAHIDGTLIPYKDYDDSIIGQYIDKWKSSDNKYLKSIIAYMLIFTFDPWRYSDGFFNMSIDDILAQIRDNNIETIARSIDEEYYKPIMINILKYLNYNFISYNEDEAFVKAIGDDCENLMVYNKDSSDIYDVLIRANAYRLMRFNLYKRYITYIEDKTEKDIPTYLYMYIEENVFYECEISDSAVCKKLDNGGYLTSGYCIDSMGYEKEWFMNNPDCDCIYIDETPEFYNPINISLFDITFNSDPNLFEDAVILYGSREEAKKAFMESHK